MDQQLKHDPAFSMLRVDLEPGERIVAEPDAMVAMSKVVDLDAKLNAQKNAGCLATIGAFFSALIRAVFGGESVFINHFVAQEAGSVWLAPTLSGGIVHRRLNGETLTLSTGAYLASRGDVEVDVTFGGIRGLLGGEGAFFLEVSGTGDVWFNSFGGIEEVQVDGSYVVDNGHIVGFEEGLDYNISSAGGGLMGFFASGEGAVCEFNGKGTVYIQTRNVGGVVDFVTPMLPD